MDLSPDGNLIVVEGTSGLLAVLSADKLELIASLRTNPDEEGCEALFSPCGQYIVDGTWGGLLRVFKVATGEVIHSDLFEGCLVQSIASDARRSLYCYVKQPKVKDRTSALPFSQIALRKWPFEDHEELELPARNAYVHAAVLSTDGNRIAVLQSEASSGASIQIIEVSEGTSGPRCPITFGGTAWAVAGSLDGTLLCCVERGQVSVFESSTMMLVTRHIDAYPCSAELSTDGRRIAIASWETGVIMAINQLEMIC